MNLEQQLKEIEVASKALAVAREAVAQNALDRIIEINEEAERLLSEAHKLLSEAKRIASAVSIEYEPPETYFELAEFTEYDPDKNFGFGGFGTRWVNSWA